jgi:DNA-binding CsgD family transcriptional regulator/tetratricopeptide (TPR) repeat protein
MKATNALDKGRGASERQAWVEVYAQLSAADRDAALEPADLERFATAAFLLGKDVESNDIWARAHQQYLSQGHVDRAVRCAFWVAFRLLNSGEHARGGGWIARARRLLDDGPLDCVEQGYLLLPDAFESVGKGDHSRAVGTFGRAEQIGDRFADRDLVALARHSRGRSLIRMGRIDEGVSLLDEAMVAVETGEVSPLVAGDVYCSVIAGCLEIWDLRRARQWTTEMTHWCEAQPDLMAYNGQCLLRRAEILQLRGAWPDAIEAVQQACERCVQGPDQAARGAAWYRRAELHRLRGQSAKAEEAYREASRCGYNLQPGLALLRLSQGQIDTAATAIRLAVDEAQERRTRSRLLPAHVEIMLAVHDVPAARLTADELTEIAVALNAPSLRAVAGQAHGAVLLAEGDAKGALSALRHAWLVWQEIEAPYEAARVRVLIGLACRELGDTDAAEMELDAARTVFHQLGAVPDLAHAETLSRVAAPKVSGGLSAREGQVLRLVAAGKSNRQIASELFISERTVERHVSNIFIKLDVSSRSAATAYAYEHQLL